MDSQPQPSPFHKLDALAQIAAAQLASGAPVSHGGRVRTIAAGHYTVNGLSEHVRLGEFVVHKSATGLHLGEELRRQFNAGCPLYRVALRWEASVSAEQCPADEGILG